MDMIRDIAKTSSRLITASVLLLLAAGTVLGLYETLQATRELLSADKYEAEFWLWALVQAAIVILIGLGTLALARRERPVNPRVFLMACIGVGLVVHLLLAALVKPVWSTDYLRYWQHAQELARHGDCGGLANLYCSRSLFIPYPVVLIFGIDATYALKLANIMLLAVIQAFAYDILRRVKTHQAAQAGSLLLLAAPMPAYATLIPSHDLWGLFFIALFIWLITLATSKRVRNRSSMISDLLFAALIGIVAYLAEIQRNIGPILCLALVIASVVYALAYFRSKRDTMFPRGKTLLLLCLISIGTYFLSDSIGGNFGLGLDNRTTSLMMRFAADSSGLGNGNSDWSARFRYRFGEKAASSEEATDFARSIALSSIVLQPIDHTAQIAKKGIWLFSLNYPKRWNRLLRNPEGISTQTRSLLILYTCLFAFLFGSWLAYALVSLAASNKIIPIPILTLLVTILGIAAAMLLLFSNKPLNLFPVWLAGTLTIGFWLRGHNDPVSTDIAPRLAAATYGILFMLVVALLGWGILRVLYAQPEGRLLAGWQYHAKMKQPPLSDEWKDTMLKARPEAFDLWAYKRGALKGYLREAPQDGRRIRKYAGDTVTRMEFPGNVVAGDLLRLETEVCRKAGQRNNLEFFLFAPKRQWVKESSSSLDITVGAISVEKIKIPFQGKNFRRITVADAFPEGCHRLAFNLHVDKTPGNQPSQSPMVEIWLARLIE